MNKLLYPEICLDATNELNYFQNEIKQIESLPEWSSYFVLIFNSRDNQL